MFRNSRTSRSLTALVALMALSVGGCAGGGSDRDTPDLIESIILSLDALSEDPLENGESITTLVGEQTVGFALLAGGAVYRINKEDGTLDTQIFDNTDDSEDVRASYYRFDDIDQTGLWLYLAQEDGSTIQLEVAVKPRDREFIQSAPFTSYRDSLESYDGTITYQKFAVVDPLEPILGLEYATFGSWSEERGNMFEAGFFFSGVPTKDAGMPTTGSASYTGLTVGAVIDANLNVSSLAGDMALAVNFADGSVDGEFTSMMKTADDGTSSQWRDFSMTASINASTDSFTGTTSTNDGLLSGDAEGAFFGPGAAEVAGAWTLSGDGEFALGSFGGGKD